MTLRFVDSFDDRSSGNLGIKYNSVTGAGYNIGAYGRNATKGLQVTSVDTGIVKTLDPQATWIIGFAFNPSAVDSGDLMYFRDGATIHCRLTYNADHSLSIKRETSAALDTTSAGFTIGVWTYVEVKFTVSNTVGVCVVKFDGTEVMNFSGDTKEGAGPDTANSITFFNSISGYVDDLYICDANGSQNNNFLGDVRIECLIPNNSGSHSAWTPSAGLNYQNVDDDPATGPDGDTTYNESGAAGDIDSFAFPSLASIGGVVHGVAVNLYARKTEPGTRTIVPMVRIGSTDYDHPTPYGLQETYSYDQSIFEEDPSDSNPFTIADVNAAEFGYKLDS